MDQAGLAVKIQNNHMSKSVSCIVTSLNPNYAGVYVYLHGLIY